MTMNIEYNGRLNCVACGKDCYLESNQNESYILCMYCLREYLGGYDELLLLNRLKMENNKTEIEAPIIQQALQDLKQPFCMN